MKISTRGRYALRLMLDLAEHGGSGPVRLRDAAQRQALSEKYLEQIIAVLRGAGYVRSVRGPQGGYVLCRPPESYTVGMILFGRHLRAGRLGAGYARGHPQRGGADHRAFRGLRRGAHLSA